MTGAWYVIAVISKLDESIWKYFWYAVFIVLFAFPLLFFMGWDFIEYDPAHTHHMLELNNHTIPDHLSPARYIGWISYLVFVFGTYQIVIGKHNRISGGDSISRLLYDGSLLYVVAGIRDKVYWTEERIPDGVFIGLITLYSMAFAVCFWMSKHIGHTVVIKLSAMTWSMFVWVFVPSAGVIITTVVYHLMTAWRVSPDFFYVYLTVVIVWIVAHSIAAWRYGNSLHLHHWYWALYASHACIFNTDASMMCQAAFIAIYLHGVSVYGSTSIFEPEKGEKYDPLPGPDVHI